MKSISIFMVLLRLVSASIRAENFAISDPELDYALRPNPEVSGNPVDAIMRLDVDVEQNGILYIFLAPSLGGSKSGMVWSTYIPDAMGTYSRLDCSKDGQNLVVFRADTFRAGKVVDFTPKGGVLAYAPGKGGGDLVRFVFKDGDFQCENIKTMEVGNPEDEALFNNIFHRKWNEPLPPEYFTNPPFKVVQVKDILKRSVKSASDQKPQQSDAEPVKIPPLATPSSKPVDVSVPETKTPAVPTTPRSWPYWIFGVALVFAIGWFAAKKK